MLKALVSQAQDQRFESCLSKFRKTACHAYQNVITKIDGFDQEQAAERIGPGSSSLISILGPAK